MRKSKFRREHMRPELIITSMIDVVLFLLIFFVVATQFKKDTGVRIERPQAKKVVEISSATKQHLVTITRDNKIRYDKMLVTCEKLEGIVPALKKEHSSQLIIIPDKSADVGILIKVLDVLSEQGYSRYSIAVDEAKS